MRGSTTVLGLTLLTLTLCLAGAAPAAQRRAPTVKEQLAFGIEMAQRGLWSEALFRFRQAEKLDPEAATVLNNLAVSYEALGQFEEALRYYQRALRISPADRNLKRNYARFAEFYQSFKKNAEREQKADKDGDEPPTEGSSDTSGRRE